MWLSVLLAVAGSPIRDLPPQVPACFAGIAAILERPRSRRVVLERGEHDGRLAKLQTNAGARPAVENVSRLANQLSRHFLHLIVAIEKRDFANARHTRFEPRSIGSCDKLFQLAFG